ncbi:MAG: molybdenum cofactor biosynthesis protein MoaA [Candidatus Hadarchaeum yellowstonense]|uniref:Molybdenum cofactor biosynthesis protein MoaA n=1 Tax=Hadarchaeum yellowstonense TaxID=1776334 RepID=A0A147JX03_HADYE|nr:MAG: molybdenum cofactor biosynthesis protein MoaA [Candidatus Hadarchaeum yellowstonense]
MLYDPLELARQTEEMVLRGTSRKYYRIARAGRWYGGIATADCCGCCLRCVFCWSGAPRDHPETIGRFYTPEQVFEKLTACAEKLGYRQLRLSGNEPTIGREHLLRLLELVEGTSYRFILESNGILIDRDYARSLSEFQRVHVRISIKGTNREEFSLLTGAVPEGFDLQLEALRNLVDFGASCHPAVMLSFSPAGNLEKLKDRLREIKPSLADEVEEEYVFLYPHVVERLSRAGIRPRKAYSPGKIPDHLV